MGLQVDQLRSAAPSDVLCPDCHSPMRRVSRVGFFQRVVMPWFGYYPWECGVCRTVKLFASRGGKRRRARKS